MRVWSATDKPAHSTKPNHLLSKSEVTSLVSRDQNTLTNRKNPFLQWHCQLFQYRLRVLSSSLFIIRSKSDKIPRRFKHIHKNHFQFASYEMKFSKTISANRSRQQSESPASAGVMLLTWGLRQYVSPKPWALWTTRRLAQNIHGVSTSDPTRIIFSGT